MAGMKNRFTQTTSNLSQIRTPTTPDNKYKRIGLLLLGLACIAAGIIIWITAANSHSNTEDAATTVTETTVTEQSS